MTNESGLSISKPTPVLKKSIKVNFKDFSKALGKGIVDLGFGKWDSLAGDGVEALTTLGLAASIAEIAWLLVYRSLLQAMKNLIDEKTELEPEKFDIKALQNQLNQAKSRVIGILCKSGSKERICVDSNTQYTKF